MLNFIVVLSSAVLTTVVWGLYIDPFLEKRPRKAVFVKPRNASNKPDDKKDNAICISNAH